RGVFVTSAESINDSTSGRIIATNLDFDSITGQYSDEALSNFTRDIPNYHVRIIQSDSKHAVRQRLRHQPFLTPFLLLRALLRTSRFRHRHHHHHHAVTVTVRVRVPTLFGFGTTREKWGTDAAVRELRLREVGRGCWGRE
ncbi:hypothetical protein PanWU01x14_300290, partial [Parasponia andersonii]